MKQITVILSAAKQPVIESIMPYIGASRKGKPRGDV